MKSILSMTLLLAFVQSAISQHINGFEKVDFGKLSDYSVAYELGQDTAGSIWVATDEGLLRHNSLQTFLYSEYEGLPEKFSSKISNIYLDSKRQVWITSDDQIAILDPISNVFKIIEKDSIISNFGYIYDIKEYDNSLYLAAHNGLWYIDIEAKPHRAKLFQLKDQIVQYLSTTAQLMFIGTGKGSYVLDHKSLSKISSVYTVSAAATLANGYLIGTKEGDLYTSESDLTMMVLKCQLNAPISDLILSKNGDYYTSTDGKGIFQMSPDCKIKYNYRHNVNDDNSLPNDGIYDLHVGNSDQLWIASYGGGIIKTKIGDQAFKWISHITNSNNGLANNFARTILHTKEGNNWFGTKAGISVQHPDGTWTHKNNLFKSGTNEIILDLFEDGDYVWVGSFGNGALRIDKRSGQATSYGPTQSGNQRIPLSKVYAIHVDQNGTTWFGGVGAPLCFIRKDGIQGEINVGQVRELAAGMDGVIYSGGRQGVWEIKDGKAQQIRALYDRAKFDYSTINCIHISSDGNMWIGTQGDGLIKYNPKSKQISVLNMSKGLPSDAIQGIIQHGEYLWCSTSRGLVRINVDKGTNDIKVISERDGIQSATFNYGSYATISDHELAFGTANGVLILDTEKLKKPIKPAKLVFESINVLSNRRSNDIVSINLYNHGDTPIKLKYWQNVIKVTFASIDHLTPHKYLYAWKMKGVNKNWSPYQSENEISFVNLSPGSYLLEIKAINPFDNLEVQQSITIDISPPWWASKLAYLLYLVIILGLIYGLLKISRSLLLKRNADEQISFYNNITHELKTPLTILLNKLDNHHNGETNNHEIKSTIHRLNALFDQLLNFKKVNSEFYKQQKVSAINLDGHFKMIAQSFQTELTRKNISFTYENNATTHIFYYKQDVFDKVTFNLMSNAVKYTGNDGAISIRVREEGNHMIFVVTDNGIGIPKDQHKDILKRYYRARNAVNSQLPGTGLGLMIVKNLLETDHGNIAFVSEQGLGTSFTVTMLNLKQKYRQEDQTVQPSATAIDTEDSTQKEASNKPRILIVEDNDELRIDMVEKLSEYFSIMAARDGKEGYDKAKSRLPDLIITDLIMPEMDGIELCKILQSDENTVHIPVFMMTVLNDSTHKVESIKSGVNTFMTKPVDFPFLIAKINAVLEYKNKIKDQYIHETEIMKASQFKDDREAGFVNEIEEYILSKVSDEEIAVQDLCKHVGMSRTALYMKLKEIINQSPQEFIINTKMNFARGILLEGGKTIQEISFMVGYNNPKYFSTSFKKQFGVSPSQFLKSLNPGD